MCSWSHKIIQDSCQTNQFTGPCLLKRSPHTDIQITWQWKFWLMVVMYSWNIPIRIHVREFLSTLGQLVNLLCFCMHIDHPPLCHYNDNAPLKKNREILQHCLQARFLSVKSKINVSNVSLLLAMGSQCTCTHLMFRPTRSVVTLWPTVESNMPQQFP